MPLFEDESLCKRVGGCLHTHATSAAKVRRRQLSRSDWGVRKTASVSFYGSSLIFKQSFILLLSRKRSKTPGTRKKISPTALCSQVAGNVLRSSRSCRKLLVVQAVGTKELAFHALTATLLSTAQTTFVLSPLPERLFAVIFYGAGLLWKLPFSV